jgi:hypothetical protein
MSDVKDSSVDASLIKEIIERMTMTFLENASHAYYGEMDKTFMDVLLKKIEDLGGETPISPDAMIYLVTGYVFGKGIDLDKYKKKPESFMKMVFNSGLDVKKRKIETSN